MANDPETWPLWAEQRYNELPTGIPTAFYYEICKRIDLMLDWGCDEENHSLTATLEFIEGSDFASREDEILEWLASIGGHCDCSIQTKAYKRLLRLFDIWEEWDVDR